MDSVTTGFSLYIDHFLQPIVFQLESYVRDSTHLLELLSPYQREPTYTWLSLDVCSLYTSIPHSFGLMALEQFLSNEPLINPRQASFILSATLFCLTHNYFTFNGDFFHQIQGTAMCANFAPSYANLAIGYWENNYIYRNNPFSANIAYFGRYIDDIIIIWDGPQETIPLFIDHCNSNLYGLSFTSASNPISMTFLDLELGHDGHSIWAKNYTKPTAGNSYLHFKSCHLPSWKNNIPNSQFCRLRQNCTKDSDYIELSQHLKKKFTEKQYPESLTEDAFKLYLNGKPLKPKRTMDNHPVRFMTTFHYKHKKMESILVKHWDILLQDPHLKPILPARPKITYRRAPNLKNKIAPSKLKPTPTTSVTSTLIPLVGMYQCRKSRCKTCHFVQHGQKNFHTNGKTYPLKDFYNCSSEFVVYGLSCPCGLLYIGRTIRPLRERFGEHRRNIEGGTDPHSVPRHFTMLHQQSTSGLQVWIIEQIDKTLPPAERFKKLCARETYWIYSLDTLSPGGINESIEISTIL